MYGRFVSVILLSLCHTCGHDRRVGWRAGGRLPLHARPRADVGVRQERPDDVDPAGVVLERGVELRRDVPQLHAEKTIVLLL